MQVTRLGRWVVGVALVGALGSFCLWTSLRAADAPKPERRAALVKTMQDGNFKEAYEGFRQMALAADADPRTVGEDLENAVQCLYRLNRVNEVDAFREAVIAAHAKNWRLLAAAAGNLIRGQHFGFIIAGEFERGQHRGGGQLVNSIERDRIRALQLMVQALPLVAADKDAGNDAANFYVALSRMLLNERGHFESWRLQYLSDLATLPDYDQGWGYQQGPQGAPVDADGKPVFHTTPKSWEVAETDGQRWRWALEQAVEVSPTRLNEVRMELANFLWNQFGVQTMSQYGFFFGRMAEEPGKKKADTGTFALHTLSETETIARLATGIARFELPEEFNFIRLYRQVADDAKTGFGEQALGQLAQIFENRRQYPKAAELWRRNIKEYGDGNKGKQLRLDQIVGNWGQFENVMGQPAGAGATVEFRYRNGKQVAFEAHLIKVPELLKDVKAYLKSNPGQLDWKKLNIGNIGYMLVQENQQQYVGERVAQWKLELDPAPNHFDRRLTVTTPLQKAGAYLVTATMADGNVSKIILWISDTAIVKKPLPGKALYYVADAVTGAPIPKANVEFFGYWQEHVGNNQFRVLTKNFAENTNADGIVLQTADADSQKYQWIATATAPGGRFAYLGFTGVWAAQYHDAEYNQVKVFTITDRPVYRPSQSVKFKFWIGRAQYDQEGKSPFADQTFQVEIHNPKGEKVLTKALTADQYGGMEGEYPLPADATLGVYGIFVVNHGGSNFRVEEYKKPEYEVTIEAPTEPVMLGEKITATIKAKYYFGAPVTEAKVKYKVLRTSYTKQWYASAPWDWLYGRGYWWYACDYPWYPGWDRWGCRRPIAWWFWMPPQQPEVVAEREARLEPDGTLTVPIDTAVAKAIHPDQDHSYQITAEVVDASRRTIVGTGQVLVARQPFKVFAWVDRGYYRVGDTIRASFFASTLDEQPVKGQGKLTLLKISYKDGKPVETPVRDWQLDTDAQGRAELQIKATAAGQYRLKYVLTDSQKHTIEGGYLFTIIGDGFDGHEFRFNEVELITDQRDYDPGQKVKLQVNANRAGATVLLFVRPANGVYLAPQVLRLEGKSTVQEIEVVKKDMPNFFVEALVVSDGKVHTETREIHVPPEKRVLGVEVIPSAQTYRPGQHAKVKVKLTDFAGKAYVGSTVLAIYDKAVEYISGGSNVPEIKEFFWKWRRQHHANTETSLQRFFGNMTLPNKPGMSYLGVFGASVVEEWGEKDASGGPRGGRGGFGGGGGGQNRRMFAEGRANALDDRFAADAAPAAPAAAAKPGEAVEAQLYEGSDKNNAAADEQAPLAEATVRTNFADTALWKGSITTDGDGLAEVELDMPENLSTWKVKAWGMGDGTRVGQGSTEVVTRKDLIVRLQAPRFFVEKDEVVLSANVHNYLKQAKQVRVILELEGKTLEPLVDRVREIEVPENGEARVDWRVKVVGEGQAIVRMKALTDEESDAMQMTFPVYVHGMLKMDSYSGVIRPEKDKGSFTVRVPAERRINESRLEVRYSPTLAGAMVDALPYLIDYPYGCTEQTLNRFLPAVITQKVLIRMGLDLKQIEQKRTNLNAQEIGDDRERAAGWKRFDRNPVFSQEELGSVVKTSVQRLTEMQLSDGGWGWFSGWGEHATPHTTATVVHGLQMAQANDVALVPGMLDRGVQWLKRYQDEQVTLLNNAKTETKPFKTQADNIDALVYMVLVDAEVKNDAMMEYLYRDRTKISVYGNTLLGLALHKQQQAEKLAMVMRNISQFVVQDDENQTAYLNLPDGFWWFWFGSEFEAHAYYLKLLAATDPKSETASRLVKYLLNNRKHATYWNSTRDTALVIEAMADYLKASGEDKPDMTVELWLDGKKQKEVKITAADLFTFDNKLVLTGDAVETGEHTIELRKIGKGPLYFNGYLTNFTLEDHITKAGLELKVQRKYYKLIPEEKKIKAAGSRGQVVDQKVEKYRREPLVNLATLKSSDLVEIELEIESKNDYEYIVFEDMKAAGFEPVALQSGYTANGLGAYMELRDNRVSMFVQRLARGRNSISYRARAEIPGKFSALPTRAYAMYAPELKGNSDEIKLKIED